MTRLWSSGSLGVVVTMILLAGCAGSGQTAPTSDANNGGATVTRPTGSSSKGPSSGQASPTWSLSLPPTKSAARPPTSLPTPVPPPGQAPAPGSGDESADLTIVIDDGTGVTTTWSLTCLPAGGTHPTPDAACRALADHGDQALPPVPKDMRCTMIFGGPQRAHITGTWRGQPVDSTLSRQNGCEISRWNLLAGLLPSGEA